MRKIGLLGLGLLAALKSYAIDLPPAEDLIIVRFYMDRPVVSLEFDTDHDGMGDHKFEYEMEGVIPYESMLDFHKKRLLRYKVDRNRNGTYDDDEVYTPEDKKLGEEA